MNALVDTGDFPILSRKMHGKRLVYLDNAATTQKPTVVIDALSGFYRTTNATINRGIYALSHEATEAYSSAREATAALIGARPDEVVFAKNATEALNIVAHGLKEVIGKGDEIIVSVLEHHANFVPWQVLAKKGQARLVVIPLTGDGVYDLLALKAALSKRTKIVALSMMSNVLGVCQPVEEAMRIVKDFGPSIMTVVDAAQAASHMEINVKEIGCDFLAFSAHKFLGPSGVGVLFGRAEYLSRLDPLLFGGDMIDVVTEEETVFAESPRRFEAGTQNPAAVCAFAEAIAYVRKIGLKNIEKYCDELGAYAWDLLSSIPGMRVYSPRLGNNGILSFNLEGIHCHDVASLLDSEGIAVRAGHHCAMPLAQALGIEGSCRASFYVYNTKEDAGALRDALLKVRRVFHG